MRIIIDNADQNDFNELAKLARAGKINTFCMTDDERPHEPKKNCFGCQGDKDFGCEDCLNKPKGDLIRRSDVMKLIPKVIGGQNEFADCIRDSVKQVIDNAPIVPQGEWIIVKDEKFGDNVKCPFCGKELAGTDLNFCCKCGAKLIGSEKMNGGAE